MESVDQRLTGLRIPDLLGSRCRLIRLNLLRGKVFNELLEWPILLAWLGKDELAIQRCRRVCISDIGRTRRLPC